VIRSLWEFAKFLRQPSVLPRISPVPRQSPVHVARPRSGPRLFWQAGAVFSTSLGPARAAPGLPEGCSCPGRRSPVPLFKGRMRAGLSGGDLGDTGACCPGRGVSASMITVVVGVLLAASPLALLVADWIRHPEV
jgi:hypothetical protein